MDLLLNPNLSQNCQRARIPDCNEISRRKCCKSLFPSDPRLEWTYTLTQKEHLLSVLLSNLHDAVVVDRAFCTRDILEDRAAGEDHRIRLFNHRVCHPGVASIDRPNPEVLVRLRWAPAHDRVVVITQAIHHAKHDGIVAEVATTQIPRHNDSSHSQSPCVSPEISGLPTKRFAPRFHPKQSLQYSE